MSENFEQFQQMYHPIWQETFKDVFDISNGQFKISQDSNTRKFLMSHLNDNVFQNIDKLSVKIYDEDVKFHKHEMKQPKKELIA